jgi:hypothetical protein
MRRETNGSKIVLVDNGQSFNERDEISTRQAQSEREPGAVHCARLRGPTAGHQSRKELFRRKRLRGGGSALKRPSSHGSDSRTQSDDYQARGMGSLLCRVGDGRLDATAGAVRAVFATTGDVVRFTAVLVMGRVLGMGGR